MPKAKIGDEEIEFVIDLKGDSEPSADDKPDQFGKSSDQDDVQPRKGKAKADPEAGQALLSDDFLGDDDLDRSRTSDRVDKKGEKPDKRDEDDVAENQELTLKDDELPNEEELRAYSTKVKTRIDKLTRRFHDERRMREQSERDVEEQARALRATIDETNRLKDLIAHGEKVMIGEAKGRLNSELSNSQTLLKMALDTGDADEIAKAQVALSRVTAQMERVNTYQPQPLPHTEQPVPKQVADPKAVSWADQNRWFGRDEEMTAYAMGLHQRLVSRDGIRPDGEEYYEQIDKNLRMRFPERFQREESHSNGTNRTSRVVVGSAARTGSRPRRVTLSESQVRVAKRLGLTNEQYAEQVLKDANG